MCFRSIFRHEKKVLALVLAFACAFTMFAGAASFTDAADIEATEAVNMLTALGVIEGYEDGSFQPNGVVTRAEMAKMIFVIWNGGEDDASAYQSMNSAFGDTTTHWARGYINFCAANNIIAGVGNNRFNPDATVTGQEAAKMLLTIIGYDEERAGLTGANWAQNTMSYAGLCGLFNDVDSPVEQGLPRQYAAQMIYNALDTNRVKWSNDSNSFDEIQNWTGTTFEPETVGERYMDYSTEVGILVEPNNGDGKGFGLIMADANGNYDFANPLTADFTDTKYTTDLTQYLGQEVKVAYDSSKKASEDRVYGVFATDNNTVVTSTLNKVERVSTESKIKIDGTSYKYDDNGQVFTLALAADDLTSGKAPFTSFATTKPNKANTVKFVDVNADSKFDIAIIYPLGVGEVSAVSGTGMSLKTAITGDAPSVTAPKLEDVTTYDGIAKGDLVTISYDYFNDKVVYTKADVVNDTINGARSNEYQLGSDWVKAEAGYTLPSSLKVGDKVDAVVENGIVYYMKKTTSGAGDDVAVVVSTGATAGGAEAGKVEAKLMFADGTTKTVNVDKFILNDGNGTEKDLSDTNNTTASATTAEKQLYYLNAYLNDRTANGATNGKVEPSASSSAVNYNKSSMGPALVTYSTDNDGNYELQLVDAANNDANYDNVAVAVNLTSDGTTTIADNTYPEYAGSYEIKDDAVVLATYKASDVKKMTGKEFKKYQEDTTSIFTTTKVTAMVSKDSGFNYATVVAVDFTDEPTGAQGSDYGFLTQKAWNSTEDGTKYVNFKMLTADGEQTVKWEKSMSNSAVDTTYPDGAVIAFDWAGEGMITNVVPHVATEAAITGYDGGKKISMLKADGTEVSNLEVNSDTTIIYADTDEKTAATGALDLATELVEGKAYVANALYYGAAGDMEVIVYDVNSNLYGDNKVFSKGTLSASDIQDMLNNQSIDSVTITTDMGGSANISVPAGKTLTLGAAQANGAKVTLDKAATLVLPNGNKFGAGTGATANGSITFESVNSGNGVKVTAAEGTVLTLTATVSLGSNDEKNFYVNGDNSADSSVTEGTYTYYAANSIKKTSDGSASGNSAGWFSAAAVTYYQSL